tara:strand:- start:708 stop:1973 length:1266 start_codon:yes stop_codon:yes gene_type:complete
MNLLIKAAKLIDEQSKYHLKVVDILIEKGKISQIAKTIKKEGVETFEASNLHVSNGWIDLHAQFHDPGNEHKEDFESGMKAAAKGGFTRVCISPLTEPVKDTKSAIEYVINKSKATLVELLPYASISKSAKGEELAELYDMKEAGAVANFDGKNSIKNPNLLHRALQYSQAFDGLVINFPHTEELASSGVMNEGESSTHLGLKGIPELTEELMVSRDLYLLRHAGGKLHFATISASDALTLIQSAKKEKLKVSCDVSAAHLLLSDDLLKDFDSRLKVIPPFRSKETIKQLIKHLKNGTIDAICSDHQPEDIESKKKEFDHAAFGIINLQTAFAAARTATQKQLSIEELIPLFTTGPSRLLGLEHKTIEEGNLANLTLFNPDAEYIFEKEQVVSKSLNSPFFGMKLKGMVYGVINRNQKSLS